VFLNGAAVAARAGSGEMEWLAPELGATERRHVAELLQPATGPAPQRAGAWSRR
jgi:hypothetical protein